MGGVLRGGNRDMLQPSEKTREKERKEKKYSKIVFLFICEGFRQLEESYAKIRPGLVLQHYGKTKM